MSGRNKKYLIVAGIMVISLLIVFRVETSKKGRLPSKINLKEIPYAIGQWQGEDIEVSGNVIDMLETKNVIMRRYSNASGDSVVLAVVYSENNRDSIHPPEICYLGGGVKLLLKSQEDIPLDLQNSLTVNRLLMSGGSVTTKAWYWFLAGERFVSNYYIQQLYFLVDALMRDSLQSALIRISVHGDSQEAENKAREFIKDIYPFLRDIFNVHKK